MIQPLKTTDFGLDIHQYRRFSATVPGNLKPEDLENPTLWSHVAPQIQDGDEVRAVADDRSFVVYLICTFSRGSQIRLKTLVGYELESVDHDLSNNLQGEFEIKLRGPKKWCIVSKVTGEVIKEGIPTQSLAMRELEEHYRAMAS